MDVVIFVGWELGYLELDLEIIQRMKIIVVNRDGSLLWIIVIKIDQDFEFVFLLLDISRGVIF